MSFLSVFLLLNKHILYVGWDTQFHFKRIMELKESILYLHFFPDFSFNEFHGSSIMTLYPYLNLLPAVLLSFVVKSKINLIYSFCIFNTLLTFIISFYSSKNYIKSYNTSYIFSFIYGLSSIFLTYNFVMSDFGIISTYIFLPLVIFGILQLFKDQHIYSWLELSLGISLIMYSHILNFIIICLFILIFLIININELNKKYLKALFKALLLSLTITSIFWIPFIYINITNLGNIYVPSSIGILNKISIKSFLLGLLGDRNSDSIGFFPIISIFISPIFYKKFNRYIKQIYWLSIIITISSILLPWRFITLYFPFKLLGIFQFIWRFLFIPQMILSFIFALIITQYIIRINIKKYIFFLTIIIAIILQLFVGQYITIIKKNSNNPSINNHIIKNEQSMDMHNILKYHINNSSQFNLLLHSYYGADNDYIPKSSLPLTSLVNKNIGIYNKQHLIKINRIGYNTFKFKDKTEINNLTLPLYLYNDEKVTIYLNNSPVKYHINNQNVLTIYNIKKQIKPYNKIYIRSSPSKMKIISIIFSSLGWIFIIILFIKKYINYK